MGLLSLLLGLLFLFSPEALSSIGKIFNRTVLALDEMLSPIKTIIGIILVLVSGWMLWSVFPYAGLWYLNITAYVILFFGLLFVFFPTGLKSISDISNRVLLSTDDLVLGARKTIGVLLIMLSVYIFYSAFYMVLPSRAR